LAGPTGPVENTVYEKPGFVYTEVGLAALAMTPNSENSSTREMELARVLLVDDDLAARLTLQAVLQAGGYFVDAAASTEEALGKLDHQQYELVLSDLQMESPESGLEVLAHARLMDYKPATALVTTYQNKRPSGGKPFLIEPEDLPGLLTKVADLISRRAARIVHQQIGQ
jgi:CheY-like chemotaxis protein